MIKIEPFYKKVPTRTDDRPRDWVTYIIKTDIYSVAELIDMRNVNDHILYWESRSIPKSQGDCFAAVYGPIRPLQYIVSTKMQNTKNFVLYDEKREVYYEKQDIWKNTVNWNQIRKWQNQKQKTYKNTHATY